MTDCDKFTVHDREEQADLLAQKVPNGDFWTDKYIPDTVFRNLLIAVGIELSRIEQALNDTFCETQLATTNAQIKNWERDYGIIGGCLDGYGTTIDERIEAIRLKISTYGTSTKEQFEALAVELGLNVEVIAGYDRAHFPYTFPIILWRDLKEARFTMVVDMDNVVSSTFPLTFPFVFGDAAAAIMKCLFYKLKPSNTVIKYINE